MDRACKPGHGFRRWVADTRQQCSGNVLLCSNDAIPCRSGFLSIESSLFGLRLLVLSFLVSIVGTSSADVLVVDDVAETGLERGDRIVELIGSGMRWPVADPLAFELAWLECSAQRACRIEIERDGRRESRALWMASVPVKVAGDPQIDTLDESELSRLAAKYLTEGKRGTAAWYQLRRAERALHSADLSGAEMAVGDAAAAVTDPNLGSLVRIEFARLLLSHEQTGQGASLLDELSSMTLPLALGARVVRLRCGLHFQRSELTLAEAKLRAIAHRVRVEAPGSHLLAGLLNSLAVVIRPQGRIVESRALFDEARRTAAAFAAPSVMEVMIVSNMALLERAAGDLPKAESLFHVALAMLEKLPPQPGLRFDTQANLALVLLDRGRTREAAAIWNLEVPTNDAHEQERNARAQQNLALVFAAQGNPREAVRRMRMSVDHWRVAAPDSIEEANARLDLGTFSVDIGAFDEAREALAEALRLHRTIAPQGTGVINSYDALATLALARDDAKRAEHWQRRALALRNRSEQAGWRRDTALTQLAQALHQQGNSDAALTALTEAQAHAKSTGRDAMLANALTLRGEVLMARGESAAARTAACDAVERIELLRGTSPSGAEFRAPFTHQAAPIYRRCMDAALAVGDVSAVLGNYQRERRGVLQALLVDRDLRFRELPEGLANERGAALAELQRISAQLDTATENQIADLKQQRARARAQLRRIDERIAVAVPQLQPWSAEAAAAPARAPAGHTVIAYSVGKTDTLRIVLSDGSPRIDRLPIASADIENNVAAWRQAVLRGAANEPALARTLHQSLLSGLKTEKTLVVVPDGALHRLPFAALLAPDGRRLIEDHFLALASLLPGESPCAKPCGERAGIDLLAFAEGSAVAGRNALPGVDIEVDGLRKLGWPRVEVLRGPAATADALFREGPNARRLHFAAHGVNDAASPMDSALMLRSGAAVQPLAVWRIFEELRLDAELVVLAACDTAPGLAERDDGWLGLTRAFQFAGAAQVISALWPVGDHSTAALMAGFHRHLAAGAAPAEALAKSQREAMGAVESIAEAARGVGGVSPVRPRSKVGSWAAFHVYWAPDRLQ